MDTRLASREPNFVKVPETVVEDVIVRVKCGDNRHFFEFHNNSRFHVLIGRGEGPAKVDRFDPSDVILPYSSKAAELWPKNGYVCYVATAKFGFTAASALSEDLNNFWLIGSEQPRSNQTTYQGVGISGRLINISRAPGEDLFIAAKLSGDLFNRLEMYANGVFKIGPGFLAPEQIWNIGPQPGKLIFSQPPELADQGAIPDYLNWQFVTANWVAQEVAAGSFTPYLADNALSLAAGPSNYPKGLSIFRRTIIGDWPEAGTVVTFKSSAVTNYVGQLFFGRDSNDVYRRGGAVGDTWAGFLRLAYASEITARTYDNPGLAAGFAAPSIPPVTRRSDNTGLVTMEGQVKNTSGASKPGGSRLFTVISAHRPIQPVRIAGAHFDISVGTWDNASVLPFVVGTDGQVTIDRALAINDSIGFAGAWMS